MNRKHRRLQITLRWVGVWILFAGLLAAVSVYWTTVEENKHVSGYEIVGATAYEMIDMGSKSDVYEVQRYGGTMAVMEHKLNGWLASLWHGKRLAYTLAALAGMAAYACFWFANELNYYPVKLRVAGSIEDEDRPLQPPAAMPVRPKLRLLNTVVSNTAASPKPKVQDRQDRYDLHDVHDS